MASPYTAHLADGVKALVESSLGADGPAAEQALASIEHRVLDIEPRSEVPFAVKLAVFVRDCWTCRYCGGRTVAPPVLRVLSAMYPDRFPYHPNWKAGQTHPAYPLLFTTVDHVLPVSRAGRSNERENLVAACWPCNSGKGDFTLEEIGWNIIGWAEAQSDWDGLTGSYAALWEAAGRPEPGYHRQWLAGLGPKPPAP